MQSMRIICNVHSTPILSPRDGDPLVHTLRARLVDLTKIGNNWRNQSSPFTKLLILGTNLQSRDSYYNPPSRPKAIRLPSSRPASKTCSSGETVKQVYAQGGLHSISRIVSNSLRMEVILNPFL